MENAFSGNDARHLPVSRWVILSGQAAQNEEVSTHFSERIATMDFHTFTINREAGSKSGLIDTADEFYTMAFEKALARAVSQFYQQLHSERIWEEARKPHYNVWPSIVPMLTRLNLDLDSALIQLPLPALCIRLPKQHNPLAFRWQDQPIEIRSILLSEINDGRGLSLLIDIGETMDNSPFPVPLFTYRNFPRREGLTVEQSLGGLGKVVTPEDAAQIPETLLTDCVRLCCSLCLLENDPSVIEPDVLSKDRDRFEASGDAKYVDKAHRRGKIGWNVGRRIEVAPHYRRPHTALVWTGRGRAVPRVVHRELVEKVPSGFGE
jgi:hypothetical protein